jgi:hypothetical protein
LFCPICLLLLSLCANVFEGDPFVELASPSLEVDVHLALFLVYGKDFSLVLLLVSLGTARQNSRTDHKPTIYGGPAASPRRPVVYEHHDLPRDGRDRQNWQPIINLFLISPIILKN